jgi:hypothetical protein
MLYWHQMRALAFHRLCRVEIALRLFEREHGRWPVTIDELPGRVPLNPYREEPFRFEGGVLWADWPEEPFFRWEDLDVLRVELTDQR